MSAFDFSKLALNHYLLGVGSALFASIINRDKFKSPPRSAQDKTVGLRIRRISILIEARSLLLELLPKSRCSTR